MLLPLLTALALASQSGPFAPPEAAVVVRGGRFWGSGVVWDAPAGRVLTALHVVEEVADGGIEVVVPGRPPLLARIVDREPSLDLALLEVAGALEAGPPVGSAAALVVGDPIAYSGCPEARCGTTDAHVLATARAFAGSRYLAFFAAVRPGASGGPVLDRRGALVGIVDLALRREPNVALAVPIERAAARFPRPAY
ncbi:MAG TPA: serine protease [Anaeromyxobacteraceae bacterium]|nr:serine protease [Anaeromyxobacteraceae bacterium]